MIDQLIKYQQWRTGEVDETLDEIGLTPAKITACINWAIESLTTEKADNDAEVAAKAVENCADVKRFRWLCENVTDEVCQSGELVALKTKYKLPLMIAYADFCGPIRFADAVDLKMQEQAAQLRAKVKP